jgi:hypothetical protein
MGNAHPFLWDLSTIPVFNTVNLPTLSTNVATTGIAFSVNNEPNPVVVGEAAVDTTNPAQCRHYHAFRYIYHPGATAIVDIGTLPPIGTNPADQMSKALDNNTSASMTVGVSTIDCVNQWCDAENRPVYWNSTTPGGISLLNRLVPTNGYVASGINDFGNIVGSGFGPDGLTPSTCVEHAIFWEMSGALPVDLAITCLMPQQRSVALKVGEPNWFAAVTVVGFVGAPRSVDAWRWERDSAGTWTAENLNWLVSPINTPHLTVATDVSDDGWIIANSGDNEDSVAVLLRPITCPGDINHDCVVNGSDLATLLACIAGPWPPNSWPDINIDGSIDGADLGLILGNWTKPCLCADCSEIVIESDIARRVTATLERGLAIIGFGSVDEFNDWRSKVETKRSTALLDWLLEYCLSDFSR